MLNTFDLDKFLVLDTETTGLGNNAEIIEISLIDQDGHILIDTLVKPSQPIPDDAIAIHGITNEMAANGKNWADVYEVLKGYLDNIINLVIYNADYDLRLIHQTNQNHNVESNKFSCTSYCAMLDYAEFWGDYNEFHDSYRWQKLTMAAKQQGVEVENAHRALGDCKMTLSIINKVKKDIERLNTERTNKRN